MSMTPETLTTIFTMYADTHPQMQSIWKIIEAEEDFDRAAVTTLVYAAFIWGIEATLTDRDMLENLREISRELFRQE